MKAIGLEEFVRLLKATGDSKGQLAFFLGAGCSISSKIPGAADLVRDWLPKLHHRRTGGKTGLEKWLEENLGSYDSRNPAASYAEVMHGLFPQAPLRRAEVDRFVRGRDPSFGYAVLARLVTHERYAANFNLILTTNFDDLVADALYLYTQQKPLVIAHESLVGFAETGLSRPLVIKLHGDALLDPKSLEEETGQLDPAIERVLTEQLRRRGLIFVGYGGNDRGITAFLKKLPEDALEWGLYWVNEIVPDNELGAWLESRRNAYWIKHLSFDELMVLVFQEFRLEHPQEQRFERLMTTYRETFASLTKRVESRGEDAVKRVLSSAVKKTAGEFRNWWSVELAAREHKQKDPAAADRIYREGLKKFPSSYELLGNYAGFLETVRKDMDQAEALYKRALEAGPTDVNHLGNYALFLKNVRKDMDQAEALYKRALHADPTDAHQLGNYAVFLQDVRKDMDQAEALYKRALEADPTDASNLGYYAFFLQHVRKDVDQAEALYKRALEADPTDANNLGYYAFFLQHVRKDVDQAEALHKRALEADPTDANQLGNYALFLQHARKDMDQAEALYKRALDADPTHANILGIYAGFLQDVRKDMDQAEALYKRALEADPTDASHLGNYAQLLLATGRDEAGLEVLGRAVTLARDQGLDSVLLEGDFYRFAHAPEEERADALKEIANLLQRGARSPGWDLSANVERAEAEDGSRGPFLRALAQVISEEADLERLSEFEEWKQAT